MTQRIVGINMPSARFMFGFSLCSIVLISSCSFTNGISSLIFNNEPNPSVLNTDAKPSPNVSPTISQPEIDNTEEIPSSKVSPTVSQSNEETYFGIPYDPTYWQLLESDQEHIPPYLQYISDPHCSMAINSSKADLSVFTMVDKKIVLGKHTWTRRYFMDQFHNSNVFETYIANEYPAEYYNQLEEGGYYYSEGIRLLGLYETCRQATQDVLAEMP
jgi:hypothetical protein